MKLSQSWMTATAYNPEIAIWQSPKIR